MKFIFSSFYYFICIITNLKKDFFINRLSRLIKTTSNLFLITEYISNNPFYTPTNRKKLKN